jgi:Sec-independent protein translocase protein TatA
MSIKVVTSISKTVSTTLGVVDDAVDGIGSAARIFKTAMASAEQESILEAFVEQKKLLADSGLTEEEKKEYLKLIA